ncbi:hypothetical protein C0J52_04682 [Blattella germanica]|nr:hypothetical protein C0J52_04682 [Blattella germanica]
MTSRPWISTLNEITDDAGKAFRELHASWEEENLKSQGMDERMNAIRQELRQFWKLKIREEKLHVLKYKVELLRNEIQTWWGKCFLSEEEREDFIEFRSTNYTEQLLDCHEKELQRLKRKFSNNE